MMHSLLKQSHSDTHNRVEHRALQQIFKESLIVCVWIGFGALTLWGIDEFGIFSSTSQFPSSTSLQVDFPAVYQIWKKEGAVFVDVRSAANFKRGHIPGAVNIPVNRTKDNLSVLPTDKEAFLITYCGGIECPNAYQLMNVLLASGYRNVKFFPRGLRGWLALGYPLETK